MHLSRSLGLGLISLYGLGNILGAGIYVLVGKVIGVAGAATPLAFLLAAIIAALTAVSYGELAARFPVSAGEAVYVQEAFGLRWLSTIVGLLIAISGMISASTLARGFTGYFEVLVRAPEALVIVCLVAALAAVAAWGISGSARFAAALTIVEAAGLMMIVIVASDNLAKVPELLPKMLATDERALLPGLMLGALLAFFAFIGFEDMINVAEEVKNPGRNLPLGILIALGVSTVFYLLVVAAALASVPMDKLAASDAPLALVYEHATGGSPVVISGIGMLAVVNGALIQIIMASRIFYGMSVRGWLPAAFGIVHPRTHTPLISTVLVSAIVVALALWFPLVILAGATSFVVLSVFGLVNIALLFLKRRKPEVVGAIPCPVWVPAAGALSSFGLLVAQAVR